MGSGDPIVSIITPTFNHERYLRQGLASAIAQTDPRWELVIVDDGSDDGTEAIARSIDDPRIRYVRRDHLGIMHLGDSYNLALGMTSGPFVAILEGDDFWPPDKIERQLRTFDDPGIVLSWGRAIVVDEAGVVQRSGKSRRVSTGAKDRTPGQNVRMFLERNFVSACTVMCRRDALLRIGGFQQPDGVPTTDYPTWLELCRVGRFTASPELLGYYRKHQGQVSVRWKPEMDHVLDWGTRFVEQLSDEERRALGLSLGEAYRIRRERHAFLDYASGRMALEERNDAGARASFRRALRNGTWTTRSKAAVGLGFAVLGLDLERLAAAVSRVTGK